MNSSLYILILFFAALLFAPSCSNCAGDKKVDVQPYLKAARSARLGDWEAKRYYDCEPKEVRRYDCYSEAIKDLPQTPATPRAYEAKWLAGEETLQLTVLPRYGVKPYVMNWLSLEDTILLARALWDETARLNKDGVKRFRFVFHMLDFSGGRPKPGAEFATVDCPIEAVKEIANFNAVPELLAKKFPKLGCTHNWRPYPQ